MNFSSPSSTRLALGPGRAVLILGPAVTLIVLVVIGVPPLLRRARLSVVPCGHNSCRALTPRGCANRASCLGLARGSGSSAHRSGNHKEGTISRYRRGWDADAMAGWPDSASDTPRSAASTRRSFSEQHANLD